MKKIDAIIVGQGIAGTLLAHELTEREKRFVVIDNACPNASLTCAGMVNPVVLKRFSPVWQGREQIACARKTMGILESKLGIKLDYPFDILRIFNNEQERVTWCNKANLPELKGLLDCDIATCPSPLIHAPHGVGKVALGGRIDLHALLSRYRLYLSQTDSLQVKSFDHSALYAENDAWCYGDIVATQVIFCEGYGLKKNPFFNELPLNGNKGEVLTVRIPNLSLSATVKSSVFIMPLPERGEDVYFVGATYNWDEKDSQPTEAGKSELLEKLKKILPNAIHQTVEILDHRAGMRPTVSDRRPLLGRHPEHDGLFVFNGLGTRGVMLGATMAKYLCALMLNDVPLPSDIDIRRFRKC